MKKTHGRRGSKGEGERKKERRKRAAKALVAAGAIAGGTHAYADPVRHDNPPHGEAGHFHWPTSTDGLGNMLDVALPAADQPGSYYANTSVENRLYGGGAVFSAYPYTGVSLQAHLPRYGAALGLNAGDTIPNPSGICSFYGDPFCFSRTGYLQYTGYKYIPEGVPAFLGVAVGDPYCTYYNNCQYGWIGVVLSGKELEAFAWGFESTPNTPINAGDPQPAEPAGACCDDATGACTETVTQADCEAAASRWGGDGSDCTTIDPACVEPCPIAAAPTMQQIVNTAGVLQDSKQGRMLAVDVNDVARVAAIQVEFVSLPAPYDVWNGRKLFARAPIAVCETGSIGGDPCPTNTYQASRLECTGAPFTADWNAIGTVNLWHEGIVPGGTYKVRVMDAGCNPADPESFSDPTVFETAVFGDTRGIGGNADPADGAVNIGDALAGIAAFVTAPGKPSKSRTELQFGCIDHRANIGDVLASLSGFAGVPYPEKPSVSDACNSSCPDP